VTTSVPGRDRLLTPGEVARIFRVDPKTVTRWCLFGPNDEPPRLYSIRTPGGHRRIPESAVDAYLRSYAVNPNQDRP
jgi:hypothetical protein